MPVNSTVRQDAAPAHPARAGTEASLFQNPSLLIASTAITFAGIAAVHPQSLVNFLYYLIFWNLLIAVFHRDELPHFLQAFVVNSAFIGIFYVIQTTVYPESFGTTSPYGSYTDDSFFFALVADQIPQKMVLRDYFYYYTDGYSNIIKAISLLPIRHPMDVIFFQSGVAALLSTFSRRYALQETGDPKVANAAYYLTMLCPFLMMNGGVILVRDTFAAALFIYSLCCFNKRQWPLMLVAVALQFMTRPGTALLLVPAYFILNLSGFRQMTGRRAALVAIGVPIALLVAGGLATTVINVDAFRGYLDSMSLSGRDTAGVLFGDPSGNQILLAIQDMPFWLKFPLNGIYMFLYPFLGVNNAFGGSYFDVRSVVHSFLYPILTFWFNAWFVAGVVTREKVGPRQRLISAAFILTLLMIGTYSLQTRHKAIVQPLYYVIGAIGFARAKPAERHIGYLVSGGLLVAQIVIATR